jgi:RNA polymerase sigma factor (sigma-70 family)
MTEDAQPILLSYLNRRYANLKVRLTRMLGNADLASDALHDTWLRLQSKDDQRPMQSPGAYLVRMAVNIAVDIQRRQGRMLAGDDIDQLLEEMVDPAPGPEQIGEARSELAALHTVIHKMPERRREIVILVHLEEVTHKEAAEQLGVSLRTVEYELKQAHQTMSAYAARAKNK